MNTNLAHLLAAVAGEYPARPAIIDGVDVVRYGALAGRAGGFALAAREAGLAGGGRAAILLERGADAAAAIAGIYAAGGVAVVINERLRPAQVEHRLADCGADLLVTSAESLGRLGRPLATTARIVDAAGVSAAAPLEIMPRGPGDLAQIIYTSGSTGQPKGVVFSHGAIRSGVAMVATYLGLLADDRVAGLLPLSSVYGLNQLLCNLAVGSTMVIERSVFPVDVVATLARERVSVVAGVPPLWLQLLAVPAMTRPLPSLRLLQNAGGHLPVPAVRALRAAQPQADLFLQYGMTETWRSTFLAPDQVDARPGSMGRGVPGADILVVRDDGRLCGPDEPGELVHAGPTLAEGYWGAPPGSDVVFRAHPSRPAERAVFSGDLVRRDAEGFLTFVGRRDRMIKTMGYRVSPYEITDVLHASGEVAEAEVTAEPDPTRGQQIVAWVVLVPAGSVERLVRYCRRELPPFMQPARIETRTALPRLASGKFDYAALEVRAAR